IRALPEGWLQAMGVHVNSATADAVEAELLVEEKHLQAYGIVHGGVHCGLIESLASIGAALYAAQNDQTVVGLENHTSFLRAARAGSRLRGVAKPLQRGRRTQVWEAEIHDERDRVVAS